MAYSILLEGKIDSSTFEGTAMDIGLRLVRNESNSASTLSLFQNAEMAKVSSHSKINTRSFMNLKHNFEGIHFNLG